MFTDNSLGMRYISRSRIGSSRYKDDFSDENSRKYLELGDCATSSREERKRLREAVTNHLLPVFTRLGD